MGFFQRKDFSETSTKKCVIDALHSNEELEAGGKENRKKLFCLQRIAIQYYAIDIMPKLEKATFYR
jgi:hypothetical protein